MERVDCSTDASVNVLYPFETRPRGARAKVRTKEAVMVTRKLETVLGPFRRQVERECLERMALVYKAVQRIVV